MPDSYVLPKLPKGLKDHPLEAKIEDWFRTSQRPLRTGSFATAAVLPWTPSVEAATFAAQSAGHLLQGLELIKRVMDKESEGLLKAARKSGEAAPERLSRLMILACDGSDRFYRGADSVLRANQGRLAGCLVDVDSARLGDLFSKKKQPLKALLISDRKALETFLTQVFVPS